MQLINKLKCIYMPLIDRIARLSEGGATAAEIILAAIRFRHNVNHINFLEEVTVSLPDPMYSMLVCYFDSKHLLAKRNIYLITQDNEQPIYHFYYRHKHLISCFYEHTEMYIFTTHQRQYHSRTKTHKGIILDLYNEEQLDKFAKLLSFTAQSVWFYVTLESIAYITMQWLFISLLLDADIVNPNSFWMLIFGLIGMIMLSVTWYFTHCYITRRVLFPSLISQRQLNKISPNSWTGRPID